MCRHHFNKVVNTTMKKYFPKEYIGQATRFLAYEAQPHWSPSQSFSFSHSICLCILANVLTGTAMHFVALLLVLTLTEYLID
jgi:hypothetical protein